MAQVTPNKSNLGRPAGSASDKVRGELINSARQHFLAREFKAVSVRQIAESAGVNGAMINYYFGGKKGLYLAMVDDVLNELDEALSGLRADSEITLADFGHSYSLVLARNPWWPNFMIREVLFSDGEVREAIVDRFGSIIGPKLFHLVQQEIDKGNYRDDLNPQLAIISFMGMTIFPFIARPLIEQVFGINLDEAMASTIAQHNQQLFMQGVAA